MRSIRISTIYLLLLSLGLFSGCKYIKEKTRLPENKDNEETYFSIKQFLDDQWNLLHDQPILLLRVAEFNGKKDSAYVELDSTVWRNIRKQFDPADISNPRFLGQYDFSYFEENRLNMITLNYTSKNKKLFTKTIDIEMDNHTQRVRSIYIETSRNNRTYMKSQKLTYFPRNLIRIQTFEKSVISKSEELSISYYFKS